MLKSMTAYAFTERGDGDLTVTAEIRSYNSRNLDLVLRLPMGYAAIEDKLKAIVASAMERGRVELRMTVRDNSEASVTYQTDLPRAKAYCEAAFQLRDKLNLANETICLEHLLGVQGIVQPADNRLDIDNYWPLIESVIQEALAALDQMRCKEGAFVEQDFSQRLSFIEEQLKTIETAAAQIVPQYRDRLQARVESLTQGLVEIDPSRIAQEASMLADRSDISEEIVRARSHVEQFRTIMAASDPAGRKLNFLLQEFNREFNTMGAKVGKADLAHIIVDIKSEIEKLREQVQNIE